MASCKVHSRLIGNLSRLGGPDRLVDLGVGGTIGAGAFRGGKASSTYPYLPNEGHSNLRLTITHAVNNNALKLGFERHSQFAAMSEEIETLATRSPVSGASITARLPTVC